MNIIRTAGKDGSDSPCLGSARGTVLRVDKTRGYPYNTPRRATAWSVPRFGGVNQLSLLMTVPASAGRQTVAHGRGDAHVPALAPAGVGCLGEGLR